MQGLRGVYRTLESQVARQAPPDLGPVCELSGPGLLEADERDVARLLLLAAVGSHAGGGPSATAGLLAVSRRYEERSFLCTGRSLPRAGELIGLLDAAVAARSSRMLAEVADHLGQGWPGYPDSVLPAALAALAARLDPGAAPGGGTVTSRTDAGTGGDPGATPVPGAPGARAGIRAGSAGEFAVTPFTCRDAGLRHAAAGRAAQAAALLRQSAERYRATAYRADAAWLFTDVVLAELMAGRIRAAAAVGEEQRRYVEEVFTTLPPATGPGGGAPALTRPPGLRPKALGPEEHEMLLRYLRISQFLIEACRHRSPDDFAAALDLLSFGWTGFAESPYPRVLRHLADRYAAPGAPWDVHLTAQVLWHRMLRSSRVAVTSAHLVATAVALRARLGRAGLPVQADVALLDAAVVHARSYGTGATVEWITRYVAELRPRIPELLRAAITYLQAPTPQEAARLLASYTALRAACAAPDLLFAADLSSGGPLGPAGPVRPAAAPHRMEVAFYGSLLSVEGITVHPVTPPPLQQLLWVLGEQFTRAGERGEEVPFLSAAALAERTGRTPAALAQTVRRFRAVCQERFTEATARPIGPEAVIQGRPGYRLNPDGVELFRPPPAPVSSSAPASFTPKAPAVPPTSFTPSGPAASPTAAAPHASVAPPTAPLAEPSSALAAPRAPAPPPASRTARTPWASSASRVPSAPLTPSTTPPPLPHPPPLPRSRPQPPTGSGPAPSTRSLL